MLKPIVIAAAATSLLAAVPAAAQEAAAPKAVVVSTADLNLASHRDVKLFERRVANAVALVCARPAVGSPEEDEYQACRTATLAKLRPMMAQAVAVADRPTRLAAR